MFARVGAGMSAEHQHIFIILTGIGVSITVVTLSIILIVKATKAKRKDHTGNPSPDRRIDEARDLKKPNDHMKKGRETRPLCKSCFAL